MFHNIRFDRCVLFSTINLREYIYIYIEEKRNIRREKEKDIGYSRDDESHEFRVFELSYSLEDSFEQLQLIRLIFTVARGSKRIFVRGEGKGRSRKQAAHRRNVKALKRYRRRKLISCGTRAGVGLCRAKNKNTVSTFYPGASMRLRTTNL